MIALSSAVLASGMLQPTEASQAPAFQTEAAPPPELSASSWLVFDAESGEVLLSHDPDAPRPIASVTKLISATQFFAHDDLDAPVTITWSDVNAEGRAGKLAYGEVYTSRELLFPLLLESSNDAAEALARVDSALIERMNDYADSLGLEHTSFADASGLSDQNVSTARELMALIRAVQSDEPHVLDITRLHEYYTDDNGWINNSPVIDIENYRGGKHGYTTAAGRTFAGLFERSDGRLVGVVLLGSDNIAQDLAALTDNMQ